MKQSKVIVLTGGIGSGKSAAAKILSERYPVYSSDEISREVISRPEVQKQIASRLTARYFGPDGLDRKGFGRWVFADSERTRILNEIMHRAIYDELLRLTKGEKGLVFAEIPLYFETGANFPCDEVWVVTADRERRIRRTMERDGLTRGEVEDRMKRQIQIENVKTAYTEIENNGTTQDLRRALARALENAGGK